MPTRPVPFRGTEEERQANRRTHRFEGIDGRCLECDHKPWHYGADYACGDQVPREHFEVVKRVGEE